MKKRVMIIELNDLTKFEVNELCDFASGFTPKFTIEDMYI